MIEDVVVVILAGGKSTRFWPLPHKLLLPFAGKPLLERHIESLKKAGFKNCVVVADETSMQELSVGGVTITMQRGEGMANGILSAAEYIKHKPVLVVFGADVLDGSVYRQIEKRVTENTNLIIGYKTEAYFPGGYVVLKGKKVAQIVEKPGEGNEPSNYISVGGNYFADGTKLLQYQTKFKAADPLRAYEKALSHMMELGEKFEMIEYKGTWLTLKYPWHVLSLMDHFMENMHKVSVHKTARIHKSATIVGPVVLGKHARVMEYAKIVGPAYIGAGTIIGNHVMVRHSFIGDNSVVGYGSDVTRSFIGNDSWLHSNYVGDSVLSDNVGMGAGAVLANLRLDEGDIYSSIKAERVNSGRSKLGAIVGSGARIGVQAQIMPGVKIGRNSVVGPGVILSQDLPDNQLVYSKQTLTFVKNKISNIRDRERFRKQI